MDGIAEHGSVSCEDSVSVTWWYWFDISSPPNYCDNRGPFGSCNSVDYCVAGEVGSDVVVDVGNCRTPLIVDSDFYFAKCISALGLL